MPAKSQPVQHVTCMIRRADHSIFDMATGARIHRLTEGDWYNAAFSPDSQTLASWPHVSLVGCTVSGLHHRRVLLFSAATVLSWDANGLVVKPPRSWRSLGYTQKAESAAPARLLPRN